MTPVLVVAALASRLAFQCPDGTPPPCGSRPSTLSPRSVAVLNFRLLSRDSADAYLAEGLADAITSRLSQVRRLDVASRTAARLGHAQRAAYVVSGTMLRQNSRLVVNVELLHAATGRNAWAQRYDRPDSSVLGTEQDIALGVATTILPSVTATEREALGGTPTRNPEAYDHLLRGNFLLAQRTLHATTQAIQEYETASRLDPSMASAQARIGLACALWLDWEWDPQGRPAPESVLTKGVAAATRALALDSLSSDAWMARAYLDMWAKPRTMEGVEAGFRRAIALDPRNAEAHHQLADWLTIVQRTDESIAEWRAALAIDPARTQTLRNLGTALGVNGRSLLDSAVALEPGKPMNYGMRGQLRLAAGDSAGGRADFAQALRITESDDLVSLSNGALAMLLVGDSSGARALVRRVQSTLAPTGPLGVRMMALGGALFALGDQADATALLERIEPRGAILWFNIMRDRTDLSVIPDATARRILEEARPPWVH